MKKFISSYIGNGVIEFEEFLFMMSRTMKQLNTEEELRIAYRAFDKTATGSIPIDELRNVFQYLMKDKLLGITEEEINEILFKWDINGDGDVDYKGFDNFLSSFFYFLINQITNIEFLIMMGKKEDSSLAL